MMLSRLLVFCAVAVGGTASAAGAVYKFRPDLFHGTSNVPIRTVKWNGETNMGGIAHEENIKVQIPAKGQDAKKYTYKNTIFNENYSAWSCTLDGDEDWFDKQ